MILLIEFKLKKKRKPDDTFFENGKSYINKKEEEGRKREEVEFHSISFKERA